LAAVSGTVPAFITMEIQKNFYNSCNDITTTDVITFYATSRQPRNLIFGMQPYSNPFRSKGRQAQILKMEDNLKNIQPNTIKSVNNIFFEMEDNLNFMNKEDDLK
jgi:hypothetical protein